MMRALACTGLIALCSAAAFGQAPEAAPGFEIADIHTSAKTQFPYMRPPSGRGGRYELKNASMVDLVALAYGFGTDKVMGGPNWVEMDRFDVAAKLPPDSTPETQKLMLQSLLADRFKLVVHKDTKPLPAYALVVGKKPQLKEADGTGNTGCKPQTSNTPAGEGGIRMMTSNGSGVTTSFTLGPGMTIQFECRNMTMAAFAEGLRGMMGVNGLLGGAPILDQTGLKGAWNFDVKWSMAIIGPLASPGDRISVFDAMEKQLGLKLEERQIPTPVLMVDSVNRKPTENPPGVAEALPPIEAPKEFEVADVKPTDPEQHMGNFQIQPGGRLIAKGMPMRFLLNRAFNTNNNDEVVGAPKWVDSERFDITAKTPSGGPAVSSNDMEAVAPMLRALLVDRFKLAYHSEERPVAAYTLVAAKPKLKKADPASRSWCRNGPAPASAPPGSRAVTCQNVTLAEFAERLQGMGPGMGSPVLDGTGIQGTWDIALTFSQNFPMMAAGPGRGGGDAGPLGAAAPVAADPTGTYTLFEAMEKQLGLKLESQKRPMQVIVIDHLEQKPTEN